MQFTNEMEIIFDSMSENEGFARVAVAAFATQMNPTLEEISDIKTAVSEAVTNSIIHGYAEEPGKIRIWCAISKEELHIKIIDEGCGISNIEMAMTPLYTSKPEEDRSGMGFSFMEAFMDELCVESQAGKGTCVNMKKRIGEGKEKWNTQSL